MSAEKKEIRKMIKERFASTSDSERSEMSQRICQTLAANDVIVNAKTIMAFLPLKDEVDIRPLVLHLQNCGKRVLMPEVISETEMRLRIYRKDDSLQQGVLGTMVPDDEVFYDLDTIDAVLVPGMAFDSDGHRLGRGKGYYDRFLGHLQNAVTIGICFPYQLLDSVPFEPHDAICNYVVCREEFFR